ncbi:hypothetical protein [Streptosporangium sp. H16]|uniref:hypothetical protein n=1 Tax=Streptosporangium sp. H16 TaxID=3444184 RepID=UPI003F7949A1
MIDMIHDVLAVIGALSVLIAVGALLLGGMFHRDALRRQQAKRDQRAQQPAEEVAADLALWSDYWTDHDLHKLDTLKEDKP